ncbi:MAG: type II secretion system F family protein [Alphaproteobacteria bacterium]
MVEIDRTTLLMMGAAMLAVVTVVLFAATLLSSPGRSVDRRINAIRERWQNRTPEGLPSVRRAYADTALPGLEKLIKRLLPHPETLRRRLARTGFKIGIGEYLVACVVVTVAVGAPAGFLLRIPPAIAVSGAVAAGFLVPHLVVGFLIARRLRAFTNQFPEAIDLMVRGLRSGLPISESVKIVGSELGKPIGAEFQVVSDALSFGKTLEDAMWDTAKRIDTPEFKFFVVALSVQRETGGNLAETLENLSEVLRKRRQMKQKVKALASEPKASAMILGALPFIMFAIIGVMNSEYAMSLFTDPRGHLLIAGGLASQFVGVLVMARMVRFEI